MDASVRGRGVEILREARPDKDRWAAVFQVDRVQTSSAKTPARRLCKSGCGRANPPRKHFCSTSCRFDAAMARGVNLSASRFSISPLQGPREVECRHCRAAFVSARFTQRYCSTRCCSLAAGARQPGDHAGRGKGRRFPRIRYRQRAAVFKRDGWRCRICGAPIDPELRFPHPGFGTVDHLDPYGAHEPANWQAAHLACNVAKGRKLIPRAA